MISERSAPMKRQRKGNWFVRAAGFISDSALEFVLDIVGEIILALIT